MTGAAHAQLLGFNFACSKYFCCMSTARTISISTYTAYKHDMSLYLPETSCLCTYLLPSCTARAHAEHVPPLFSSCLGNRVLLLRRPRSHGLSSPHWLGILASAASIQVVSTQPFSSVEDALLASHIEVKTHAFHRNLLSQRTGIVN